MARATSMHMTWKTKLRTWIACPIHSKAASTTMRRRRERKRRSNADWRRSLKRRHRSEGRNEENLEIGRFLHLKSRNPEISDWTGSNLRFRNFGFEMCMVLQDAA